MAKVITERSNQGHTMTVHNYTLDQQPKYQIKCPTLFGVWTRFERSRSLKPQIKTKP